MKKEQGITLISLIITIIVLVILAGIGINFSIGENGILRKIEDVKKQMEIQMIIEQIKLDILDEQAENSGVILEDSFEKILLKYGTLSKEEKILDKTLTTTEEHYLIKVSNIWNGELAYEGPEIKSFAVVNSTFNTIVVEVNARLAEEYEFYLGENQEDYQKVETIKVNEKDINEIETIDYTYNMQKALEDEKNYYLKVIVKGKHKQNEKETIWTVKYKDAFSGSVNGYSSNTTTYADNYFPLIIAGNEMNEYFTYQNNVITFKKDCIVKFKGRIQSTADNTSTSLGYYLNRPRPDNGTRTILDGAHTTSNSIKDFNTVLSVHANDYLIITWKSEHYRDGLAGSKFQGKIDLQVKVL